MIVEITRRMILALLIDTVESLLTDSSPFPPPAIGYDRLSVSRKLIYYVIKLLTILSNPEIG